MQFGDLKGLFGLFTIFIKTLREKFNVLDMSYGFGAGRLCQIVSITILQGMKILLSVCHTLPGNTALVYHRGKLLALSELDKPCKQNSFFLLFQLQSSNTEDK